MGRGAQCGGQCSTPVVFMSGKFKHQAWREGCEGGRGMEGTGKATTLYRARACSSSAGSLGS